MSSSHLSLAPEYVEAELEDSCATLLALELLRPAVATDPDRTDELIRRIKSVGQRIAELRRRHGGAANPLAVGCVLPTGVTQPSPSSAGSRLE
jgi:hypothetical protein